MAVDLFAGVAVSDYERGVGWFERLLGTSASFQPNETESVWEVSEHGWLYVELRPERAGYAMVTVFVEDLDGFLEAAATRGVRPATQETYDNGVRKAIFLDPDGNEVGFGGAPEPGVA